jgi:hypothetical protein
MICDSVTVRNGRNRWALARTDRDAPTPDEVIETAAAFLIKTLGAASPAASRGMFEVLPLIGDDARYVIGAACPARIQAVQPNSLDETFALQLPPGERLANYQECPVLRSVTAQKPWIVSVDFDWRAPTVQLPWPKRKVNDFGLTENVDHGLDWLLLGASFAGPPLDHSCKGWVGEQVEEVEKKVKSALSALIPFAVLGAVGIGFGVGFALTRKAKRA